MKELAHFFEAFEGMEVGFRHRQEEVFALLHAPETTFFIATYPSEARYWETKAFLDQLRTSRFAVSGILLNQVLPDWLSENDALPESKKKQSLLAFYSSWASAQREWQKKLRDDLGCPIWCIPQFAYEPTRLSDLGKVSALLSASLQNKPYAAEKAQQREPPVTL